MHIRETLDRIGGLEKSSGNRRPEALSAVKNAHAFFTALTGSLSGIRSQ